MAGFETRKWKLENRNSKLENRNSQKKMKQPIGFEFRISIFEFRFSSFLLGAGLNAFDDLLRADLRQMKKARIMRNLLEGGK